MTNSARGYKKYGWQGAPKPMIKRLMSGIPGWRKNKERVMKKLQRERVG